MRFIFFLWHTLFNNSKIKVWKWFCFCVNSAIQPVNTLPLLNHFLDFRINCSCLNFDMKCLHQNWNSYKQEEHVLSMWREQWFPHKLDLPYNDLGEAKVMNDICVLVQWDYTQRGEQRIYGNLALERRSLSSILACGLTFSHIFSVDKGE